MHKTGDVYNTFAALKTPSGKLSRMCGTFARGLFSMGKCYRIFLLFILSLAACGPGAPVATQLFPVRVDNQFGYMDRTGKMTITPQYSQAGCFVDGLALVASLDEKPKWGYIDNTGKYVINATYADGTSFSEGIAFVVAENGEPQAIDKTGAVKFRTKDVQAVEDFRDGLAAYSVLTETGERWGFMDKEGKTVIAPQYTSAGFFSEGLCAVANEQDKWGFIDKKGVLKLENKYDNVSPFHNGKAKVMLDGRWGVTDNTGKYLIEPEYDNIDMDGNRYLVQDGNKFGWLDRAGKVVITPRFDDAFPFKGYKYAAVRDGSKWGYINDAGKFAIDAQFDFAFAYDGDIAAVRLNDKEGFINSSGKMFIQPSFDDMSMDYYLRAFAGTSSFSGIATNKNAPLFIAYKWLNKFYHMDFEEAKTVSTDDTKTLLEQFAGMTNLMPDSSKQEMMRIRIAVKDPKEEGDKATVVYTTSDSPENPQMLYLVKNDEKWLVQFSKNDAVASEGGK